MLSFEHHFPFLQYYPDRFAKKEIDNLEVKCEYLNSGCHWTGKFQGYHQHIKGCEFQTPSDVQPFNCTVSPTSSLNGQPPDIQCNNCAALVRSCEFEAHQEKCLVLSQGKQCPLYPLGCPNENYMDLSELDKHLQECQYNHLAMLSNSIQRLTKRVEIVSASAQAPQHLELEEMLNAKDAEIDSLHTQVPELDKQIRSKNIELEDRDFRLSLIENSNHDGSMIWKIPQFSQRKADAENGKYPSIFSLPFYSGRYGYKMCLRLYIMGDGIGKGTHLSLFFVVMRGEFDNILQWPFTHKVTFKLINQAGGRDIVDTFQPDPMSSYFQKPKSDMNIASGCPRFVSHTELEQGGFIVDDTIFIKCMIDTSTIRHP